jgi:trehalose 6-phosphate synthase
MDPEERQARMQRMRRAIRERNIYHWAGSLIAELCDLRLDVRDTNRNTAGKGATAA